MRGFFQISACAALLSLCGAFSTRAQAQDQSQSGPIPAYHSPLAGMAASGDTDTDDGNNQNTVEYQPLAGVQNLSLGLETSRSYWQPRIDVSATADSNPQQMDQGPNWIEWVSGSAGADIHHVSGKSDLTVSYTAGGLYTNQYASGNGVVQSLNFVDKWTFRRAVFSFIDQSSYMPESAIGFSGVGGAVTSSTAGSGLTFNPAPTILTGNAKILNNSNAVEMDELLTPRSSLTFSGGYSLLHYFDAASGLFDYGMVNARAGYNYQMTAKDTIAVVYTFGDYRYANSAQSLMDHTAQLSYGRVITGKLAMQIAAGPQFVMSRSIASPAGTTGGSETAISTQSLLWSLNSSLHYQERRYGLGLSYNHGVSGGSGVLVGAESDTVSGSLTRQMSRTFSSGFSGGYTLIGGLPGTGQAAGQSYHYWFGGLKLTEPLSATIAVSASYQVQYQTANSADCVSPTCGENILRHMISVTFGWHERPLLF
jgi:hypothetical protein